MDKVKFNPSDYDYMDSMPLEGWIWEFVRRNQGYRSKFSELQRFLLKADSEKVSNAVKFKILDSMLKTQSDYCVSYFNFFYINKNHHIYICIGSDVDPDAALPNPNLKYTDFTNDKPEILGIRPVTKHKINEAWLQRYKNKEKKFGTHCEQLIKYSLCASPVYGIENTLYVGISTKAGIEDIERELKSILRKYIKPSRIKVRNDKWKYYLIAYDLKEAGKEYPEIADILSEAYPSEDDNKVFSEKNIENYYKNALSHINGEYKKYLN